MAHGKFYQVVFGVGWVANFLLFVLVSYVLAKTLAAPAEADLAVVIAFSTFIFLFLCFSVAYLIFILRKTYHTVIMVIVFMVMQAVCVLITSISLFSKDDVDERKKFSQDPVTWIINHRWLPILFALVFLPLFAIQTFMINRYSNRLGLIGTGINENRKSATDNPEEKVRIRDGEMEME